MRTPNVLLKPAQCRALTLVKRSPHSFVSVNGPFFGVTITSELSPAVVATSEGYIFCLKYFPLTFNVSGFAIINLKSEIERI